MNIRDHIVGTSVKCVLEYMKQECSKLKNKKNNTRFERIVIDLVEEEIKFLEVTEKYN